MLSELDEAFHGKNYTTQQDTAVAYGRDTQLFSLFLECYNAIWDRKSSEKMDAYHALENVLLATSRGLRGINDDTKPVDAMLSKADLPHNKFRVNEITSEVIRYLDSCKEYTESTIDCIKNDKEERAKSIEWRAEFKKLSLTDKILCVEEAWKEKNCKAGEQVIFYVP